MFIGLGVISLAIAGSALATPNREPVVMLDNAVCH